MQGLATIEATRTQTTGGSGGDEPTLANLQPARQQVSEMVRAASAAINRALSHDSQKFLESVRQQGAQ